MKKKSRFKNCIIFDFIKHNLFVFISGTVAFIYCCVCVIFKASPVFNVSAKLQSWGDFIYNVCISVIAAVIFYIAQVYIPDKKRNYVLKDVMRKFCKEVLIKECSVLKVRIDAVRSGLTTEAEIIAAMDASCQRANSALNKALENYLMVLPVNLVAAINDLLTDDMLYQITIRASGSLKNHSLEKIVQDEVQYKTLEKRIDRIKIEVEKM